MERCPERHKAPEPVTRLWWIGTVGRCPRAYPKKSSAIAIDLTFETVQHAGLDAGLVDNKSCAIDGNWTAVRFVSRLTDRRA